MRVGTVSGKLVSLIAATPEQIDLTDIAWSLSRINRFTGHTQGEHGITVAQHSINVAAAVPDDAMRPAAFLHDAHEAYTGDITYPMKEAIGREPIKKIEDQLQKAIHERFGLPWPLPDEWQRQIKIADDKVYMAERMYHTHKGWGKPSERHNYGTWEGYVPIVLPPEAARLAFMQMAAVWGCV